MLEVNEVRPDLLVELFAGGASVALHLLSTGAAKRIGLVDRDPIVAAFWKTVFFDTAWLVEQIRTIKVTVAKWEALKTAKPRSTRERALKCLFLNRTSFSGILAPTAGPIGGMSQSSEYSIDCRFPRETLVKRIEEVSRYRGQVAFVWDMSYEKAIDRVRALQATGELSERVLYYLDPPFFEKADKLYTHYFSDADHRGLRDLVLAMDEPWILSYDAAPMFDTLYAHAPRGPASVELFYSAPGGGERRTAKEVLLTNLEALPAPGPRTRIVRTGPREDACRALLPKADRAVR